MILDAAIDMHPTKVEGRIGRIDPIRIIKTIGIRLLFGAWIFHRTDITSGDQGSFFAMQPVGRIGFGIVLHGRAKNVGKRFI